MATMNPKTRSYGSKALKGVKLPEVIPDVSGKISGNPSEKCSETLRDLMPKIKEATNFDNQIRYLRQFIKTLAEENHSSNCAEVQFVVFWFFELNQGSSLRPVIAASLNKLGKDYYIDGQNTQLISLEKMSTGGGNEAPQITPKGCIFWTMIFYDLKKLSSRSI